MSTAEKVALAQEAREEFGLRAVLTVLELARSTWYYHQRPERESYEERYAHLRQPLEAIARRHPSYGYRRVKPELRERFGHEVNHKVLRRLNRCWVLSLLRARRPPGPSGIRRVIEEVGARANLVANLERIDPLEVLYTDFTEVVYANGRSKARFIPILDHGSKYVLGWAVGPRATTELALRSWETAARRLGEFDAPVSGVIVHHDRDPVFTSYAWTRHLLVKDGVRISYALRGARDNPEMESFFGRFKTDNRSLLMDAGTQAQLERVLAERVAYYNHERRHSSLGNLAPGVFLSRWLSSR